MPFSVKLSSAEGIDFSEEIVVDLKPEWNCLECHEGSLTRFPNFLSSPFPL